MADFHILLSPYFTDNQPNNGAFFAICKKQSFGRKRCVFISFKGNNKGYFSLFRHQIEVKIWYLFSMCLTTIESRNLVPFLETLSVVGRRIEKRYQISTFNCWQTH